MFVPDTEEKKMSTVVDIKGWKRVRGVTFNILTLSFLLGDSWEFAVGNIQILDRHILKDFALFGIYSKKLGLTRTFFIINFLYIIKFSKTFKTNDKNEE
jgi:hypothetical protein